jgi:hypothetical protein
MAWMTRQDAGSYSREPKEPDMETLSYWIARLEPVIRAEDRGEIIVVFANRCGVEDEVVYAGTSCVLGIDNGEVKLYGVLGRGEKELLVVDTSEAPHAQLVQDQEQALEENVLQSKVAPNGDSRGRQDSEMVSSIDAVLAETMPVSPVEACEQYAYFSSYPPAAGDVPSKLKSSVGINDGFSPIVTQFPTSPLPDVYRPSLPESRNSSRIRGSEPPVIAEKRMKGLEINPIVGLGLESMDLNEPNSASSLKVNTPWEKTSGFFRAEDVTIAVKSSTPKPVSPPTPSTSRSPLVPWPSPGFQGSSSRAAPPTPLANGPQSPKARNPSRSRPKEKRHPPNLVVPGRANDTPISPIVVPVVETAPSPAQPKPILAQDAGAGTTTTPSPSRCILPQPRETSTSPRPQSTIW